MGLDKTVEEVYSKYAQMVECWTDDKSTPKIAIIFLPINLNICFGCSKEPSQWDGSLSTHNICFGW